MNHLSTSPTSLLDRVLVEGNALFIDNSRLSSFTACPRKGQYEIFLRRIKDANKMALIFGTHFHTVMEYRYGFLPVDRPLTEYEIAKLCYLAELCYKDVIVPMSDHRTTEYLKYIVNLYARQYAVEDFTILSVEDRGFVKPVVEQSFAIEVGNVQGYRIFWTGRIDLGVIYNSEDIYVLDHKTSSMGGDGYFLEFAISNALKGYTFALTQLLGRPIKGALINAAIARKQTRTGTGPEFMRSPRYEFDSVALEEWKQNLLTIVDDMIHCAKRGFFPMHTTSCMARFGSCDYFDICTMTPDARMLMLNSPLYKDDDWDPLHRGPVNLEEFHSQPIPDTFRMPVGSALKAPAPSQHDILSLIQ